MDPERHLIDPEVVAFLAEHGQRLNKFLTFHDHGDDGYKYAFSDTMRHLLGEESITTMLSGYPKFKKDKRIVVTKTSAIMPDGWYAFTIEPKCAPIHSIIVLVEGERAEILSLYAEVDDRMRHITMTVSELIKYSIGCLKDSSDKCK